ncbi:hypothetical protein M0R45_002776 [Rubus argutus]|uniref:Uncharacterized protein n=1 Tax=Rubus argutus TaxID=59490 RepID=A0AAW1VNL7_RUBAR
MNGESALKSSALHPPPEYMLQQESHKDARWHSSLPSPFRAYPKENPVLLGREYLNRTNRPADIFASEQNNSNSLVNWNVYYPYRGSFN